ncbi:hypothetical protein [Leptospira levettii]|uniref:hypothetical protein n=1 Tax=Leptospira levettii TaxID=2023178 RepID=UPI003EBD578F
MQKLRFKTKNIDVLINYKKSEQPWVTGQFEDLFDARIVFKIRYPFLTDSILEKFKHKLQIEFEEEGNHLYFASSPHVILPSRSGGQFQTRFIHPTYADEIVNNMRRYVNLLTNLEILVERGFSDKEESEISF